MANRLGNHAIVIGGSIAGLTTARALVDYFDHVTILERDQLEDRPVIHKSVPQGNHLHILLQGGQQVLSSFYPGFTDELRGLGAVRNTLGRDVVWYLPDGKAYTPTGAVREPRDLGLYGYSASRGLIELLIRRRTLALPNIAIETGVTVGALAEKHGRVHGVQCGDGRLIEADLVVDAGGRGSHAPSWLAAMGLPPAAESVIGVDSAYTTAKFRRPDAYEGESTISVSGPAPDFIRRAVVVAIEDNMLLISLIGRFGDYAPTDEDGFRAFAQSLHAPLVYQLVTETERLTEITHHRFPTSIMRHYERMPSFPEGFLIAGDAVCSFHPIYAQGMSTAALHANGLHQMLAERSAESGGIGGIASAFFAKAAENQQRALDAMRQSGFRLSANLRRPSAGIRREIALFCGARPVAG